MQYIELFLKMYIECEGGHLINPNLVLMSLIVFNFNLNYLLDIYQILYPFSSFF